MVARETNAAIVPVKIAGSTLQFGKFFVLGEVFAGGGIKQDASAQEIADYIREKILEL